MLARAVAFTSVLALAVAVVLLVQDEVPARFVSVLVLGGLGGFAYVAIVLTDHRFDLLLAVLGAHRTDELHDRLLADELYGASGAEDEAPGVEALEVGEPETGEPEVGEPEAGDPQHPGQDRRAS